MKRERTYLNGEHQREWADDEKLLVFFHEQQPPVSSTSSEGDVHGF
uniref:Uncharacterized protein n=1 Tax=Nelumbo nucifera TaxID=4432 RepID=A0A822YCL9_NELNU|nr:TPA_asm: hypothetical protein HUJ06_031685 [Nelumbo nucifera]